MRARLRRPPEARCAGDGRRPSLGVSSRPSPSPHPRASTNPRHGPPDALRVPLPPRLRPHRRLHHPDGAGRPGGECRVDPGGGAGLRRPRHRSGSLPGTRLVRLLDRRPAAAGRPARCGGGGGGHATGRLPRPAAGAGGRRAAAPCRPRLQLRAGHPSRPAARRGAEELPAELPGVLREAPVRLRATGTAGRHPHRRPRGPLRPPTCCSRRRTSPAWSCTPRSARISGCRSRRAARRRWPAPPCCSTSPAARSPSARRRRGGCSASRRAPAASRPMPIPPPAPANRPPTSPGTARPRSGRTDSAGGERALPAWRAIRHRRYRSRPAAAGAHAARAPSTTTAATLRRQPPSAASVSGSTRRTPISACERPIERFPFVPANPDRLAQDCYEAYNIQVAGLVQRLRGDRRRQGSSSASPAASIPPMP